MGAFDDLIPQQTQGATIGDGGTGPSTVEPMTSPDQGASGNAFSDLIPQNQEQQQPQKKNLQYHPGAFMSMVEGFNRAIGRTAEGGLQLLHNVLPDSFNKSLMKVNQDNEEHYAQTKEEHPYAATAGELAGYVAQEALLPMPKGGGILSKGLQKVMPRVAADILEKGAVFGLTGAGLMGSQYGTLDQRIERAKYAGEMSFLFGAGAEGVAKGLGALRATPVGEKLGFLSQQIKPQTSALHNIASDVVEGGGLETLASKTAAATRNKVALAPAEALNDPAMLNQLKNLKVGPDEIVQAKNFLTSRNSQVTAKVNSLIDNLNPTGKDKILTQIKSIPINPRAGSSEVSLDQMFNKLWSTPQKQSNFLSLVEQSGGDVSHANDVISIVNQIRKSPLETLIAKPANNSALPSSVRSAVGNFVSNLSTGRYNKAILNLSLDPTWKEKIAEVMAKPTPVMQTLGLSKILEMVGKGKISVLSNRVMVGGVPQGYTDTFLPVEGDSLILDEKQKQQAPYLQ